MSVTWPTIDTQHDDRTWPRPGQHRYQRACTHVSSGLATALARLVIGLDDVLGNPEHLDIVDLGADDDGLLSRIGALLPLGASERVRLRAGGTPAPGTRTNRGVSWCSSPPTGVTGMIIVNEWLDGAARELGILREAAWRNVLTSLDAGLALAVGRSPVALDACAVAGLDSGASASLLTTQGAAVRVLGGRGEEPPLRLASSDPKRYLHELQVAGDERELLSTTSLGGFGWLIQAVSVPLPAILHTPSTESATPQRGIG